jgi:hypothetical protein
VGHVIVLVRVPGFFPFVLQAPTLKQEHRKFSNLHWAGVVEVVPSNVSTTVQSVDCPNAVFASVSIKVSPHTLSTISTVSSPSLINAVKSLPGQVEPPVLLVVHLVVPLGHMVPEKVLQRFLVDNPLQTTAKAASG